MDGYIKLHRQIISWEWYDDSNTFRLFIHLLIKANHADADWRGIEIKRGQLFTSIGHLSSALKLSDKAIRIAMDKLIKTKEVVIKGANNGTMITICKYNSYQSNEETKGQTKRQTKGEQRATNKNDKNDKELFIIDVAPKTWRDDFDIYKKELNTALIEMLNDKQWMLEREKFNPNVDIKLTLEKCYAEFWGVEKGWVHKKKSATNELDWKATMINAIKKNKVYKQYNNSNNGNDRRSISELDHKTATKLADM